MTPPDKVKIVKVIECHLKGGYRFYKDKSYKLWRLITRENDCIFTFSSLNALLGLEPLSISIFNLVREYQYNKSLCIFANENKWLASFDVCSSLEEIMLKLSILGYWK